MKSGKALRVICILLVGLLFIQHEVSAEFTLSSIMPNVMARVTEKTVELDLVPGSSEDGDTFDFKFVAGECTSNLHLKYSPEGVFTTICDEQRSCDTFDALNKVEVTDAGMRFVGLHGEKEFNCAHGPVFDPISRGFKIYFSLTGDVPKVFSMTSKAERFLKIDDVKGSSGDTNIKLILPWWVLYIIFPFIGFFIFLLIAISVFVGVILCRRAKARKAATTKAEAITTGEKYTETDPENKITKNDPIFSNTDQKDQTAMSERTEADATPWHLRLTNVSLVTEQGEPRN